MTDTPTTPRIAPEAKPEASPDTSPDGGLGVSPGASPGARTSSQATPQPPAKRSSTFGPSALLTPANGLTLLRLLATPLLIALIMLWGPSWETLVLWIILSFSDGLDGFVARRQGTTRSGAFLDPLADKVVVLGALIALVAKGIVWWLPVVIIAIREVGMSVYRAVVGRRGVSIPARKTAKIKTLVQDLAIGACLIPSFASHGMALEAGIWIAAALTVFTGAQYYLDGRSAASHNDEIPAIPNPTLPGE